MSTLTRDSCGSSATAGEKIIASDWSETAFADSGLSFRSESCCRLTGLMGECDAAPLGIQSSLKFCLAAVRCILWDGDAHPRGRSGNCASTQCSKPDQCGHRSVGRNRLGTPDRLKRLHERKGI